MHEVVKTEKSNIPNRQKESLKTLLPESRSVGSEITTEHSKTIVLADDLNDDNVLQPQDSTDSDEPKISQEAYDEAIRAERNAKSAKKSFIAAFPTLLIPGVGILISLAVFGLGSFFYARATRARFTTSEGQFQEEQARKWRMAYLVLMGVSLLVAVTIITLILFL